MSMMERKIHTNRKGESRAHSLQRKYGFKKMAAVVNHVAYARHHGFESAKRGESVPRVHPAM